ncbi:MAG: phosphoribosylformylglycinamidine synthase [Eubacteriales bacterium]
MSRVTRVFVEKKPTFDVEAQKHLADIRNNLGMTEITGLRFFCRYDVEGAAQEVLDQAMGTIFSEPQVDLVYSELPALEEPGRTFAVEYLPGQYDQRADSCAQCIAILTGGQRPLVRSAKVFHLVGQVSDEALERVKHYLINPVEAREASMELPQTLDLPFEVPTGVETLTGFVSLDETELEAFLREKGLAMDLDDLKFCQQYFAQKEGRDPTITEIRMIDTYWSDHCRHTTFLTKIDGVEIADGYIEDSFKLYCRLRDELYTGKNKDMCLMDLACIGAKYLKKIGRLDALDVSEEINACSVHVDIEVDGKTEPWLLMFKNETHNHPTEIEPFGGAATCLGGAIRDPLSGRSYVYQAMRVTGAGDPRKTLAQTREGKLPQRVISTTAAAGYSSYGNQIGLATGHVNEVYHEGYVAKRLEIGAVVGAAPLDHVKREVPQPGDIVILLGGRTGRDGCGGATGSSKSHTLESLATCGAEVQKGNAPEERKLQRLFRNGEATRLIKRCNDFGAGGVSVAIGELADGLRIDLNAVPKKYEGLDGTELAISESQERMAVVVAPQDVESFIALAAAENLEATVVATVTQKPRLSMVWNDVEIVSLSREFLNSNGAPKHTDMAVPEVDVRGLTRTIQVKGETLKERYESLMQDLNVCSQKGLVERFDSSIGAGTVVMPYGGQSQLSQSQFMAALFPVLHGHTQDASLMAYGMDPYAMSVSPYHGAIYGVMASIARVIAAGGSLSRCWLTFQEYFERTGTDPRRWGKPFAALLGALTAQIEMGVGAIGGKDSMSGTFMDLDVPPTLCSFAVSTAKADKVVCNHFTKADSRVYLLPIRYDENRLPDFADAKEKYALLESLIAQGRVLSSFALTAGGIAEAVAKMCFGNALGFQYEKADDTIFNVGYGCVLLESDQELDLPLIGVTTAQGLITLDGESISVHALRYLWEQPLEKVFPVQKKAPTQEVHTLSFQGRCTASPSIHVARPRVFIPVFPGTNCEYDTARRFEEAGAVTDICVFRNVKPEYIGESIDAFVKGLEQAQILMVPGGFSGGDEPDGSGKFIATALRNPRVSQAVMDLLYRRDGLALGICNGFQALIKLGLVPFGEIREMDASCPTLTYNTIGRHQSNYVYTRIASVKSPWLNGVSVGDIHAIPISHGEGRFVATPEMLRQLEENGQIATQYVDLEGNASMDIRYNPNGSMMAIEGITSPDGRVLGKMGHSERMGPGVGRNIPGDKDQKIFASGVKYFL